jgi:anti-sigma B factor antagonist
MRPSDLVQFEMGQVHDPDGVIRVSLSGELDLAVANQLEVRLRCLKTTAGSAVRLDLSRLEFIDSTGLRTLITSAEAARRDRWQLEIDHPVSPQVQRVIELVDASPYLWPSRDPVAQKA